MYLCIYVCVCVYGKMKKKQSKESVLRMTGQTIIYKTE